MRAATNGMQAASKGRRSAASRKVVVLHDGLWFDIGRHEDYELAAKAWAEVQDGSGRKNGR